MELLNYWLAKSLYYTESSDGGSDYYGTDVVYGTDYGARAVIEINK